MDTATSASPIESATAVAYRPPSSNSADERIAAPAWPLWQRVLFRFFFAYLLLQIAPWNWFRALPGAPVLLRFIARALSWAVREGNTQLFHVRATLVPVNGSGDTSFAWAQLWLYLSIAVVVCVVWSAVDLARAHYQRLAQWLRLIVRYYIATAALSYGIIKLFLLQMPFPALSQLATPLGDLLPMRLSWLFIGYSAQYQFFSGTMETLAGVLLLYRRTVTAGLLVATGAFMNVVMINLSYDVPVKLFSSQLLLSCLFLLALDSKRLLRFLVLNQPVAATNAYAPLFVSAWQRWLAVATKVFIIFQILVFPLRSGWQRYQTLAHATSHGPFTPGVYDVRRFLVNHDTLSATGPDTLRWRDVIFDGEDAGSVGTADQIFWQRYRRGYFRYRADTAAHTVAVWKTSAVPRDSTFLFTMRYELLDTNVIHLHAVIRGDSISAELVRVPRHFQLAERQFHLLSEYNR